MLVVAHDAVNSGLIITSIVICAGKVLPADARDTVVSIEELQAVKQLDLLVFLLGVLVSSTRKVESEPCFNLVWLSDVLIALIWIDLDHSAFFLGVCTSFLRNIRKSG